MTTRFRYLGLTVLVVALGVTVALTGRSGGQSSYSSGGSAYPAMTTGPMGSSTVCTPRDLGKDHTYVIYPLDELGSDADLGKWLTDTIPEVIEPSTWKGSAGAGTIRCYAPKKILVVYQSPKVQTKVDEFLKKVKKSLPTMKESSKTAKKTTAPVVLQVEHRTPQVLEAPLTAPALPAAPSHEYAGRPKHLFHFIIRYEGQGIIDDSVVKFAKVLNADAVKKKSEGDPLMSAPVAAPAPPPAVQAESGGLEKPVSPATSKDKGGSTEAASPDSDKEKPAKKNNESEKPDEKPAKKASGKKAVEIRGYSAG